MFLSHAYGPASFRKRASRKLPRASNKRLCVDPSHPLGRGVPLPLPLPIRLLGVLPPPAWAPTTLCFSTFLTAGKAQNVETCLTVRLYFDTFAWPQGLGKREKHKFFAETCFLVRLHWPPPNPALEIALPTAKCLEIRVSE